VHYVKLTGLSKRDMCREIALAAGVAPAAKIPSSGSEEAVEARLEVADKRGIRS
jgi:hypothetical protein